MSSPAEFSGKRLPGLATSQGTLRYAARFQGRAAAGHFRDVQGSLVLSSVGIGTYLGEADDETDRAYTSAVVAAIEGGFNVVDSAINYRLQRSERSVGAALKELAAKGFPRDEIILCTKAAFLTPDGDMPEDANEYFSREYIEPGIFRPEEIAAGCHCMTPRYLEDQLDRSRRNLAAFAFLESAVSAGKIGAYGLATWNAFRDEPKSAGYVSLAAMEEIAREAGGKDHHFRFVQLPLNLAMPEALLRPNQVVEGKTMAMVQAARPLGITLMTSAALLQGQLTQNLPRYIGAVLGLKPDPATGLQSARSVPGVTTALAGMSHVEHVRANLDVVTVEPAPRDQFLKLLEPKCLGRPVSSSQVSIAAPT